MTTKQEAAAAAAAAAANCSPTEPDASTCEPWGQKQSPLLFLRRFAFLMWFTAPLSSPTDIWVVR